MNDFSDDDMAVLNDRLNNPDPTDPPEGRLDRAAGWVFDFVADGPALRIVLVFVLIALVSVFAAQINILVNPA